MGGVEKIAIFDERSVLFMLTQDRWVSQKKSKNMLTYNAKMVPNLYLVFYYIQVSSFDDTPLLLCMLPNNFVHFQGSPFGTKRVSFEHMSPSNLVWPKRLIHVVCAQVCQFYLKVFGRGEKFFDMADTQPRLSEISMKN